MAKMVDGERDIPDVYTFTRYTGANVTRHTYPINLWLDEARERGADSGYRSALEDLQNAGVELPAEFKEKLARK